MKELLELKSVLDNINPENDNIPLELLDELNEKLQYALGWCEGWLTKRSPDSPYVCLHCGAHISSEHLPWCKSLPQNGGR